MSSSRRGKGDSDKSNKRPVLDLDEWEQSTSSHQWQNALRAAGHNKFYQDQIERLAQRNSELLNHIKAMEQQTEKLEDRFTILKQWYDELQACYLKTNDNICSIHRKTVEKVWKMKLYCQRQQNVIANLWERTDIQRLVYADDESLARMNELRNWSKEEHVFIKAEFDWDNETERIRKDEECQKLWDAERKRFSVASKDLIEPPQSTEWDVGDLLDLER